MAEVAKGRDIIKVAQEFRHVNYGRLIKGLGPRTKISKDPRGNEL